jgi:hypothetical protein
VGLFFVTKRRFNAMRASRDALVQESTALLKKLTDEQFKNGKLRKAIHDAVDVMEKVAPVEEGK